VDVLAAEQTAESDQWFQGTADAVRQSMHHFLQNSFDYALILSGDQLYHMDFNELIEAHEKSGAEISVATYPVSAKDATAFGIMKTDSSNKITSFIEKPSSDLLGDWGSEVSDEMKSQGRHYLASMGIYVFNRDLLIRLMEDENMIDFGKDIIPQSIAKGKTYSYQFEGYWTDIGTIDAFFEANIGLADDIPQFNLFDQSQRVYTRARMLPTSKISGTILNKAVIADGCIINAQKVEQSVIGIRSRIGANSIIKNTYMMGSDYYESLEQIQSSESFTPMGVGENCNLDYCIIDKNARVGNNVTIKGGSHLEDFETELYMIRDGVVVVKKDKTIADGTVIGS
tara:strand:- start:45918 stop:46940 length:1023 start_codon:yes stop_codon:yes gene_type:complete